MILRCLCGCLNPDPWTRDDERSGPGMPIVHKLSKGVQAQGAPAWPLHPKSYTLLLKGWICDGSSPTPQVLLVCGLRCSGCL